MILSKMRSLFLRLVGDERGNEILQSVMLLALAAIIGVFLSDLGSKASTDINTNAASVLGTEMPTVAP